MSISILTIVVIVFSSMITYNYFVSRNLVLKNMKEITRNLTSSAINKSEGFFLGIEKAAINSALFITDESYFFDNTESILSDILVSNPDVYGSCIAYKPIIVNNDTLLNAPYGWKENSEVKFRNLANKDYNYLLWDWYTIPVRETRNVWSEPYYDEGGGDALMTTFSVPSYKTLGDTSSFVAVQTVDVSLKWLNEMLSSMKFFESGFAFLISKEGKVISHPNSALVMKKEIGQLARDLGDKQFEELTQKMLNGEEGFTAIDKGFFNQRSLVYYSPLQNNSWSLGFVFPENELYADLTVLNNRLIFILIFGTLLLFVFIIFLSGRITKPIRKLALIMGNDSETFITTKIPNISGSTEIRTLRKSFQLLQKELKTYICNLKDVTATKERIESEINIASKLQMSMLSHAQMSEFSDRVNIASFIKPAKEVGGDLYDYFFLDNNHLFITIGDVSGKGVGAALFMSSTITLLRAYTKTSNNDISKAIGLTSEFLCNNNSEKYFVTLFAGILNLETNELTYINAGHNYPIIVSENSKPVLLNKTHMPPLGIIKPKNIKQSTITLSHKDKLFLYTDGLTEAMNSDKELYTTEALIELLTKKRNLNPQELIHDVYQNLLRFTKTADQYDDITMLCINTVEKKPKEQFQLVLNNVESLIFLDEIRVKIDDFFENSDTSPKTIYRLVLVLEELITNTYKYGSTEQPIAKIEINIDDKDEHLNITITDTGKPFDTADAIVQSAESSPSAQTIGKRGLLLVNKLTTDLNYQREDNRNKISFKLTKQ